jgi:hypothetical protein
MWDKVKSYIQKANELGIPLPVVRDPLTNKGSITCTLVVLSSIMLIASLVTSKVSNSGSFEFFLASISVYTARKMTNKSGTTIDGKST